MWQIFEALRPAWRVFLGLASKESRLSGEMAEGERGVCVSVSVCARVCVCGVGSWKSRGLQNKQAACLRLPL